ncbi:helix-turn-helix transcriptional regulator [Chromobacterium violaceum]|uniref:helix-turn-helix transcriptional regulator n=1 Tax=Chromobacterium violaceum TaxID=536 RepID=UPI001CE17860|nr:LuxR family transcriptional regulator [Chromobacterium violaceum]
MMPEVDRMLREISAGALAHLALLQRNLLMLQEEDDFRAFLLGLQAALPGWPPILLARFEVDGDQKRLLAGIDLGWPAGWRELYEKHHWYEVDPVIRSPAGEAIVWSARLADPGYAPRGRNERRRYRHFLEECQRWNMGKGLTYIAERNEYRVLISLIGAEVEDDTYTRQLLSLLLPSLADAAGRALAQNIRMSKFSPRQKTIFDLIAGEGLSQEAVAERLGISVATVKNQIRYMREAYGARTLAQLVHIVSVRE